MKTGRPKEPIIVSDQEHEQLTSIVRSRSLPHGLVMRAQIVLMAAEGATNSEIAKKVGLSAQSVCKWRQRYFQQGISGLHDELRPGRPRSTHSGPSTTARAPRPRPRAPRPLAACR